MPSAPLPGQPQLNQSLEATFRRGDVTWQSPDGRKWRFQARSADSDGVFYLDLQAELPSNQAKTWTTVASFGSTGGGKFIENETPSGDVDGVNDTFTLAHDPVEESVALYVAGLRLRLGSEFTVSGATVTCVTPPGVGDYVICDYRY